MISFKYIPIQDFMKKHNPSSPELKEIESFQAHIRALLENAPKHHTEKSQEQEIGDFFKTAFSYRTRSRHNIDLAILIEDKVNVIIEVKAQSNQKEFIASKDFPLAKALSEAIFYFLKERDKGNNFIKHIVVCTYCEYYVYDAQHFIQFEKNREIGDLFEGCKNKTATDPKTEAFYESLQEYLKSPKFVGELPYTHFCLNDNLSIEELSSIYQLLSPQVLLKVRKTLDANTLNKGFYEELLYILGLQEESEKSGGKTIITPSSTPHTFSSEILRHYGLDKESTFTLITTWNNRILFLRLLESMLKSFGHIQKEFLDTSIIKDFKTLQTLFFEVLAKKEQERSPSLPKEFLDIPYLNSSLFDRIALEQEGKVIGGLDSCKLPLFSRSILKKNGRCKEGDELPLLEYLFEFLHAYDFTTTPKDISQGVKQNHDKLINSAVLGLVFEKLNGYKEGSFYTPSFITSYMCKQSITQALIEKFNTTFGWKCSNLEELKKEMGFQGFRENEEKYFQTLLSLKICDPSVGSGHFLVSALNEMIKIAYTLKLIPSLYESTLELENDEILIKTNNELHQYTKPSSTTQTSHQIQVELFNLKKSIIENCLFGVDINPNSCEITKLRLWIELLKYSYYIFDENGKPTNALETLPNIDINIKCGNSLISNFPLDSNLTIGQTKSFSKNLKAQIQNYKDSVMLYKEGLGEKARILQDIANVKSTIISYLVEQIPTKQELEDSLRDFVRTYGDQVFDINTSFGFEMIKITREKEGFKFNPTLYDQNPKPLDKTAHKLLEKIQKSYEALEKIKSSDAFEWRFEFPEVLDEEGDFLGFDVVIGNPPYVSTKEIDNDSKKFYLTYHTATGQYDLYVLFLERALALITNNGICSLITSSTYFSNKDMKSLRLLLLQQTNIQRLLYLGEDIFESATLDVAIIEYKKKKDNAENLINIARERKDFEEKRFDKISQDVFLHQEPYNFSFRCSSEKLKIVEKYFIKSCFPKLNDLCCISRGIEIGGNSPLITKVSQGLSRVIVGRDIKRYSLDKGDKYIQFDNKDKAIFKERDNYTKPKILIQRIRNLRYTDRIVATYDESGLLCTNTLRILNARGNANLKLILGILNSSFINFYFYNFYFNKDIYAYQLESIPIPEITESNQSTADKIIALVEKILEQKEKDPSSTTQELENEIDSLVYTLYNLTDEEIKVIEGKE